MDTTWISKVPAIDQSVSDLHNKLHQEVLKPDDNAEEIMQVLDKHGFHQLSEGTQLYLLCAKLTQYTLFEEVIRANKINTMIALLPLVPLFGIAKDNIPEYKWIKSPTWMENTLYENKLRWKPGRCKCKDHNQPSNEEEKLCALTNVAFTMVAAEFFYQSCWHSNDQRFLLYLLHMAPGLLNIKVPNYDSNSQLKPALENLIDHPDLLDILIGNVPPIDIVVALLNLRWTLLHYSHIHYTNIVRFLIETVAKGHENEIRQYKDNTGSSLLHIVCVGSTDPLLLHWLKVLLHTGLDPSVRNNYEQFALDVLISSFCLDVEKVLANSNEDIDESHFMARSFTQAVQMFLPWFKDTPVSNITLPELHSTRYLTVETINNDCFNLYQAVLDKTINPRFAEHNLNILYRYIYFHDNCERKHNPCIQCKPMVHLMHQALHKGVDLKTPIWEFAACGKSVTLFECLVHEINASRELIPCVCQSNTSSLATCGCCGFQVLELIIHCWPHISHVECRKGDGCECRHFPVSLMSLLLFEVHYSRARPFTLSNICSIVKLIWLYFPEDKICAMDYLHKLHDKASSSDDRRAVSDLQDLMRTVRSLKPLCRLCILQHIQWKDIKCLPAPVRLVRYLELGDISYDHVVHKLL